MKTQSLGLQIPPHCITGAMSGKGAKDKDLREAFRELKGNAKPWKNLHSAILHQCVLGSLKNINEKWNGASKGVFTLHFPWTWCELATTEQNIKCCDPVHTPGRGVSVDMFTFDRLEGMLAVVTQNHNSETLKHKIDL